MEDDSSKKRSSSSSSAQEEGEEDDTASTAAGTTGGGDQAEGGGEVEEEVSSSRISTPPKKPRVVIKGPKPPPELTMKPPPPRPPPSKEECQRPTASEHRPRMMIVDRPPPSTPPPSPRQSVVRMLFKQLEAVEVQQDVADEDDWDNVDPVDDGGEEEDGAVVDPVGNDNAADARRSDDYEYEYTDDDIWPKGDGDVVDDDSYWLQHVLALDAAMQPQQQEKSSSYRRPETAEESSRIAEINRKWEEDMTKLGKVRFSSPDRNGRKWVIAVDQRDVEVDNHNNNNNNNDCEDDNKGVRKSLSQDQQTSEASSSSTSAQLSCKPKWTPPKLGWIKINVGIGFEENHMATCGLAARNHTGEHVLSKSLILPAEEAMVAAALAFDAALAMADATSWKSIIVEGDEDDSHGIVNALLTEGYDCPPQIEDIVEHTLHMVALYFEDVEFVLTSKECNRAARLLASETLLSGHEILSEYHTGPSCIASIIYVEGGFRSPRPNLSLTIRPKASWQKQKP